MAGRRRLLLLGVTMAWVAAHELTESAPLGGLPRDLSVAMFGHPSGWPVVAAPVVVPYLMALGLFIRTGLRTAETRTLAVTAMVAWTLALLLEVSEVPVFSRRAEVVRPMLEGTLEFGGACLMAVSAWMTVRAGPSGRVMELWPRLLAVAGLSVLVVGGLVVALAFRPPLADLRIPNASRVGAFDLHLAAGGSVIQDLGVLPAPLGGVDVRLSVHDPSERGGSVIWRIAEAGHDGRPQNFLVTGRVTVPNGVYPQAVTIRFPPIAAAMERPLAVQLVADGAAGTELRLGTTQGSRYPEGRFWINGAPAWADQNLQLVAYGAPEPTWDKMRAIWHLLAAGWRWAALCVTPGAALVLVVFIPALLVVHAAGGAHRDRAPR